MILYGITALILIILFFVDRKKTISGVLLGLKKMTFQLPVFITMSALIAISLYFINDDLISKVLGKDSSFLGIFNASLLGSIAMIPGFITFPLAGLLHQKGVPYMVLASFTNTLMMVGIVTFPVEKAYFGVKVTIMRNIIGYFIAICVAIAIGFFYKEIT